MYPHKEIDRAHRESLLAGQLTTAIMVLFLSALRRDLAFGTFAIGTVIGAVIWYVISCARSRVED